MRSIKYLALFMISSQALALPELITKQSLNNIRYISKQGNITYFQNTSGALKFASNYKVKEVKKSLAGTHFLVSASSDEKWLAVERKWNPHRNLIFPEDNNLYIGKFQGEKITKVGRGTDLNFHQNNLFFSFFDPEEREINLLKTAGFEKFKKIKIADSSSILFKPLVFMPTPNDLIYTDINIKGRTAVLIYSLALKKFETIYKTQEPARKLEVCYLKDHLIIGDFAVTGLNKSSRIIKVDLYNNPNYVKSELIYSSDVTDIGNLVCHKKNLYFIKTVGLNENLNTLKTEVAKIELETKKLEILTKLGNVNQLMVLGSYVLAPYRGKYLIVEGAKILTDDSIKKVVP